MHDPMINDSYCETFGWVSKENLARMKELTYKANDVLKKMFDDAGLILVDFKLEFGLYKGEVVLGDEFSRTAVVCGTKKRWIKWTKIASARAWAG